MVVVLPTPFTPTIMITWGLLFDMLTGLEGTLRKARISLCSACMSSSGWIRSFLSTLSLTFSMRAIVVRTPISEVMRISSSSSSNSSSISFFPSNRLSRRPVRAFRVLDMRFLSLTKKPCFGACGTGVSSSGFSVSLVFTALSIFSGSSGFSGAGSCRAISSGASSAFFFLLNHFRAMIISFSCPLKTQCFHGLCER